MVIGVAGINWTEDEVTVALGFYFRQGTAASEEDISELSELLRGLHIHDENHISRLYDDPQRFRSTGSVGRKIANLLSLDPNGGGGLPNASSTDRLIWDRYQGDREALTERENEIVDRARFFDSVTPAITSVSEDEEVRALEGGVSFSYHRYIERRTGPLRRRMIRNALENDGAVLCEVCEQDLQALYELDSPLIDCHHLTPLMTPLMDGESRETTVDDLALVCPNCHRALHRMDDCSDLDALRATLA